MALLALLITFGLQLVAISVDFPIVIKFQPPSNKQLRTHDKNFQGSHASDTAPESCLVNHEADTSIFHKHHKRLERAPSLQVCLSVLSRWPVTGSTTLHIRSKHSGAEQMVVDIRLSSDWGLNVRNPHTLQLTDSLNSEFFAPVGNTLITSRETEDLVRTCCLPSARQHLTAFDGDNTAQQPTNVLLELPHWLCFTGLRLRRNYCALAGFSWRYRPAASARKASPFSKWLVTSSGIIIIFLIL